MIENQNIILLILILISVLVAFYALYVGLSNSRKIKKQQLELINIINLNKEQLQNINHPIEEVKPVQNNQYDEFPTLEEINQEAQNVNLNNNPLDEEIKAKIDQLEGGEENNDADSEEQECEEDRENVEGHVEEVDENLERI